LLQLAAPFAVTCGNGEVAAVVFYRFPARRLEEVEITSARRGLRAEDAGPYGGFSPRWRVVVNSSCTPKVSPLAAQ